MRLHPYFLSAILLAAALQASLGHAAEFEPRYRWTPNVGLGTFDSPQEALAAYKAWEDNNNLTRPSVDDIIVLGYDAVGTPGQSYVVFNNVPNGYQFKFRRQADCPNFCYGNAMFLNMECPLGTYSSVVSLGGGFYKNACVESVVRPDPEFKECGVGNPVYPTTGTKREVQADYQSPVGPLNFTRTYRSDRNGWIHNYQVALVNVDSALGSDVRGGTCRPSMDTSNRPYCFRYMSSQPNEIVLEWSDGKVVRFDASTGLAKTADINDKATRINNGSGVLIGWDVYDSRQEATYSFNAAGLLLSITHRGGHVESLVYSDATTPVSTAPYPGLLLAVTDFRGQSLSFTYDASGRMTTMTDPSGNVTQYAYDGPSSILSPGRAAAGNLTSVQYPDLTSRTYWYNEQDKTSSTDLPFALTGITDEQGQRYSTFAYNSSNRATSTERANGTYRFTFGFSGNQTTVGEPLGLARTYTSTSILGTAKTTALSGPCGANCSNNAATAYDANGNRVDVLDFRGNRTCHAYDVARNLESVRLEGLATGLSCPANLSSYVPASGTRERKIVTQWHLTRRLPLQIDEPGKRTSFSYDASGNLLTRTELDTATSESRTWTYTYNSFGQVLTADGPRTDVPDVTTYAYYSCASGYQCGQVNTVTNALGHVTTYTTYNAHGQPLTMTDPNGVVTTLTYDLRQRLLSRTMGSEVTSFTYWPTGLLKKATLPDGSYLEYTYDAAHRLTDINDGPNNRIHYTLDVMGNRTAEDVRDPTNALRQTRSRVFNTLNQLHKEIAAAGTPQVTTTFSYDNNGNQTSIAAPLSRTTGQSYDELNRLTTVTDPGAGVTSYGYNALDQLISVTDPRSLATTYSYNALGDLKTQVSPDTGTTTNTYDSGGNLKTSTDARSAITTYTYDALNRLKSAAFKMGTTTDQTIFYGYDAGTNGKGRLTTASDASHSMAWTYDAQGRVTGKSQVLSSLTQSVGYGYTNGQHTTTTTPSGQTITYSYTNNQITSIAVNGTTVLNNVQYEPFGSVKQWSWGNGTTTTRSHDQDGKVTQIVGANTYTYAYDDAFRITGITDAANSALSWTYGYDAMDRLTSASKTGTTQGFTYDANGNRLTQTGTSAATFNISPTSNKLTSISGALTRTYTTSAAGYVLNNTALSFSYNNRGRMKSSTKNTTVTNYTYNALGQLIKKTNGLYFYDEAGHVLGQYTTAGALLSEFVWMNDAPVAVLKPKAGGGVDIFYIHTDHLNTPKLITQPSGNTLRWRWDALPFGAGSTNDNPSGLGALSFELRFPGQVVMLETSLYQNYFRDYDPATGRYMESDPIGLNGGVNTYAYANGNPVSLFDSLGLKVEVRCRSVGNPRNMSFPAIAAAAFGGQHCFLVVSCDSPKKIPETTISYPSSAAATDSRYSNIEGFRSLMVFPPGSEWGSCPKCEFEQCIVDEAKRLRDSNYHMGNYDAIRGPNSNSFARRLVEKCGGTVRGTPPPTGWDGAGQVGF